MDSSLAGLVQTFIRDFNARDYGALRAAYTQDADILTSWSRDRPTPVEHIEWVGNDLVADFPDIRIEIDEILTAGDEVVAFKWSWSGLHSRARHSAPPTNALFTSEGVTMWLVEGGKIVSERIVAAPIRGPWDRVDDPTPPEAETLSDPVDPETLEALAHDFVHHFQSRDADGLLSLYAPDAAIPGEIGGPFRTREERVEGFRDPWFTAFPNPACTVEQVVTADDVVAFKWRFDARHDGYHNDIAPTGGLYSNSAISVFKVEDGKIATERLFGPDIPMPWDEEGSEMR